MKLAHFKRAKDIFFKEGMDPAYIILYVTSKCNLKCKHCFFYKSLNKPEEISLANIEKLSKSLKDVLNVSLTGGEPFLRKDLPEIASLFSKNSNAAIISISTNGFLPETIKKNTERMLKENPSTTFNVFVSIDGKRGMHNRIRGSKLAFSNACKSLSILSKLKKKHKNLHLNITYTINKLNEKDTVDVYNGMLNRFDINQFQINFMRGNPKSIKCSDKTIKEYEEANRQIGEDFARGKSQGHQILGDFYTCINTRYKQVLVDTVKQKKFLIPCYAGTTNVIIYSNAEVYACELRPDLFLGNLEKYEFNLKKLLSTKRNKKLLRDIRNSKCFCTFECQLASNVAFNPREVMKAAGIWAKLKLGAS